MPSTVDRLAVGKVRVPAGRLTRGSTPRELAWLLGHYRRTPSAWFRHELGGGAVWVDAFDLDRVPVTNGRYRAFVDAGGYADERWWSPRGWRWLGTVRRRRPRFWTEEWQDWARDDHPVVGVTWWEADAFARWSGGRLPTEAEWEWAARGTDGRRFPWGEQFRPGLCNSADLWLGREVVDLADWHESFHRRRPWRSRCLSTPVGSFPAGAGWHGLLDLAGNVWEWCADDYAGYPGHTVTGDSHAGKPDKVCRGGSFGYFGFSLRTTERGHHPPWWCSLGIGFRCAATPGRDAP
jgi:formylglycine-generating enzyme required for sulfatase activity